MLALWGYTVGLLSAYVSKVISYLQVAAGNCSNGSIAMRAGVQ